LFKSNYRFSEGAYTRAQGNFVAGVRFLPLSAQKAPRLARANGDAAIRYGEVSALAVAAFLHAHRELHLRAGRPAEAVHHVYLIEPDFREAAFRRVHACGWLRGNLNRLAVGP